MEGSFFGNLFNQLGGLSNTSSSRRSSMHIRRPSSTFFDNHHHDPSKSYLFNPEQLTEKERLSRIVYSQRKRKKPYSGPMFEVFLVVGLKSSEEKQPEILFQYPAETSAPFPGIVQFCFPTGVPMKSLKRTPSLSNLYEMLCSHTQFQHSSNSFIFMLTTETAETYYGVCVRNEESLEHNPSFVVENKRPTTPTKVEKAKEEEDLNDLSASPIVNRVKRPSKATFVLAQKCYCLITRYPFFQLHFEILYGILALEHVYVMANIQSQTSLDDVEPKRIKEKEKETLEEGQSPPPPAPLPPPGDGTTAALSFENAKSKDKRDIVSEVAALFHRYRKMAVPNPGQSLEFEVPFMSQPLKYSRPFVDEEEDALCDYALPMFFYSLSLKHVFKLLSCALLEKKIAIVSPNLRILSSVVLSIVPLLRPFIWQSILIPILPSHMYHLLEAPLPFIIGLTSMPQKYPSDVIMVNLEGENSIIIMKDPDIPPFPHSKEMETEFLRLHEPLKKTFTKGSPPYVTSSRQLRLTKQISAFFEKTLIGFFENFRDFCMRDMTDTFKPVTVFLKEAFLDYGVPKQDFKFFSTFLDTQMFFHYQDERVRKEDISAKKMEEQRRQSMRL